MKTLKSAVLGLFVLVLVSCAEVTSTGTLKLTIHTEGIKTITLNDNSLDITKFTISGKGPGDKTFAVDTTSASISIPGIVLGNWNVKVQGYNIRGKEVASGEKSFTLTSSQLSQSIVITSKEANGSLQLKYEWDSDVTEPVLNITLTPHLNPEQELKKIIRAQTGSTSCTVSVSELKTGFYLLKTKLLNGETEISGCVEAVRIVNSEKTTGTISFITSSSYSSELTSLNVFRSDNENLTGHLSGTTGKINAGEELHLDLILDSSYSSSENCSLTWFLDGEEASETTILDTSNNVFSLYPKAGTHIVTALVESPSEKSLGSVSCKFTAKATGNKGAAIYISEVSPNSASSLNLAKDTIICPLPAEKFLIITPSAGTMRLCTLYNNTLSIISKKSATDEGYSWLGDVSAAFSSPLMNNFAIIDNNRNINLMYYDMATGNVENACRGGDLARYEGKYNNGLVVINFTEISKAAFCPSSNGAGSIILSDSLSKYFIEFTTNGVGIVNCTYLLKPEGITDINSIYVNCGKIALTYPRSTSFTTASFADDLRTSDWEDANSGLLHPSDAKFFNSENILITDGISLVRYAYSKSSGWVFKNSFDTPVKLMEISDDGQNFWVVNSDNELLTYTTQDNLIHVTGKALLKKNAVQMVRSGSSILVKASDGTIIICKISEGNL